MTGLCEVPASSSCLVQAVKVRFWGLKCHVEEKGVAGGGGRRLLEDNEGGGQQLERGGELSVPGSIHPPWRVQSAHREDGGRLAFRSLPTHFYAAARPQTTGRHILYWS